MRQQLALAVVDERACRSPAGVRSYRPYSHSKSMEFNGQRHGPAFRLRWSPQQRQDDDFIGRRRWSLEAAEAFRDEGTDAAEVTGGKGDIDKWTY